LLEPRPELGVEQLLSDVLALEDLAPSNQAIVEDTRTWTSALQTTEVARLDDPFVARAGDRALAALDRACRSRLGDGG
jgi:hypothetical protein